MTTKDQWIHFLENDHAISKEVWHKHGIKFDDKFLYIPILGKDGNLISTKKRQEPNYKGGMKYLNASCPTTLYPVAVLGNNNEIVLCEGELDALTLESFGVAAVTTTGGAQTFKDEFNEYFKDKKVHICYDTDEVGKKCAEKVAQKLLGIASEVSIINLPQMEKGKDVGDYFSLGHTKEDFLNLIDKGIKVNNDGNPLRSATFFSSVPKLISELTADQAKIDWIWEGYLAKGHLTFFSALWKVGKSTLISRLLKAIQELREFAGQPVKPTKTLILSEESETIWAGRREELELAGDIYIHCKPTHAKLSYKQWEILIDYYTNFCEEKEINLFIVDTISTFWPVTDEGNNPEIDAALLVLNRLLDKKICVLLVHHFRKSGGTEGTATRGGGGIGSRADILIEFTRLDAENPNSTQRVLRAYSRFDESPQELVIELVGTEYLARGTRQEVSKESRLQIVLGILQRQPDSTINEILDSWESEGKKPVSRTIRNYIDSLLEDGRIIQSGKKTVGKTEAPTYSLNNAGKESNTLKKNSSVNDGQEHLIEEAQKIFNADLDEIQSKKGEQETLL